SMVARAHRRPSRLRAHAHLARPRQPRGSCAAALGVHAALHASDCARAACVRASARGSALMHSHGHSHSRAHDRRLLTIALALILGLMAVEISAGIVADSLALLADAGHLLTDAAALGAALVAARLATQPAHGPWTFGLGRAEIVAAQANGIALLLVGIWIVY